MADYYVWSGATGAANGTNWANAYLTLITAYTTPAKLAGDRFFVAHDHSETAASYSLNVPGTIEAPTFVYCVNRFGSVPPVAVDRRESAQITSTGTSGITLGNCAHYNGIIFTVGSTSGNFTVSGPLIRLDNCSARITNTSGGSRWRVNGNLAELNNTSVGFGHLTQGLDVTSGAKMNWKNTSVALVGSVIPTILFFQVGGVVECTGLDLSTFAGAGKRLVGSTSTINAYGHFRFLDCKLDATVLQTQVQANYGNEVDFINCSPAGPSTVSRHRTSGILAEAVDRYRHGGSRDAGPHSWKISTPAAATAAMPFEAPPIAAWNERVDVNIAVIVEGLWNGDQLPRNDEVWLECSYQGDPASPRSLLIHDGVALLDTPTVQSSSRALWANAPTAGSPPSPTFDGTPVNCIMAADQLTITRGAPYVTNGGSGVTFATFLSSGKYYFETTLAKGDPFYTGVQMGLILSTGKMDEGSGYNNIIVYCGSGNSAIYANGGVNSGNVGPAKEGDTFGCAFDLDARLVWFRRFGSSTASDFVGSWNGSYSNSPITGAGGVSIGAGTWAPMMRFWGSGTLGDQWIGNFGQRPFAAPAPAGYGVWETKWTPFKLDCNVRPQRKGWIYGRVKVGKAYRSLHIDPNIKLKEGAVLAPLTVTGTPVTTGIEYEHDAGSAYAGFTVTASGGTAPYTYSIAAGRLPPGIALDPSTGAVSGTPAYQSAGVYSNIVIRAMESGGTARFGDLAPFTLTISYKDPHWTSVSFLLDHDAADNSAVFTEQKSGTNMTLIGAPNHSTLYIPPYGATGYDFNITGDALTMPNDPKWHLGSSPFTIDFLVRANSRSPAYWFSRWNAAPNLSWALVEYANDLRFQISTDGTNVFTEINAVGAADTSGSWNFYRVDFDGAKYRMYKNGVMVGSSTTPRTIYSGASLLYLGNNGSGGNTLWGQCRGIRLTKGVARCGSDGGYTISRRAFPIS